MRSPQVGGGCIIAIFEAGWGDIMGSRTQRRMRDRGLSTQRKERKGKDLKAHVCFVDRQNFQQKRAMTKWDYWGCIACCNMGIERLERQRDKEREKIDVCLAIKCDDKMRWWGMESDGCIVAILGIEDAQRKEKWQRDDTGKLLGLLGHKRSKKIRNQILGKICAGKPVLGQLVDDYLLDFDIFHVSHVTGNNPFKPLN